MPTRTFFQVVLEKTSFYRAFMKLWDLVRQNYIFYAWNLLVDAGFILPPSNSSNTTNSSFYEAEQQHLLKRKEVMEAVHQFVVSQHRSMKIMQAGDTISFLENHLLLLALAPGGRNSTVVGNNDVMKSAENTSQPHLQLRRLLQMDKSIREYSSIISATRGYSKVDVGKNTITDSWLQGPLQWPPRQVFSQVFLLRARPA